MKFLPSTGEIVRNADDGSAWLVVHIYKGCWLVADLTDNRNPVSLRAILPRDFEKWTRDTNLEDGEVEEMKPEFDPAIAYLYRQRIRMELKGLCG